MASGTDDNKSSACFWILNVEMGNRDIKIENGGSRGRNCVESQNSMMFCI